MQLFTVGFVSETPLILQLSINKFSYYNVDLRFLTDIKLLLFYT